MNRIRVAIVGVGNCAKSLVEGVAIAKLKSIGLSRVELTGLAFQEIGGYRPESIDFVLAYDVDGRKVGKFLSSAIYAEPNCAVDLGGLTPDTVREALSGSDPVVKMGRVLDGISEHMLEYPAHQSFRVDEETPSPLRSQLTEDLKHHRVDVLLNYLPVGSSDATACYIEAALHAKVPFVNCIPEFIVSNPKWGERIREAGIPAIGDDMRSQLGASVLSQALQELFFNRGMDVKFHGQTNHGGNTDFLNMMNPKRIKSKKISKENVIRAQHEIRGIEVPPDGIFAGPSSYIPYMRDNKVAHIFMEAEGFGGAKVTLDCKLSVQDSPNSAGVVIDAVRYLKVAHEMGLVGPLYGPSAATQKTPPKQMMLEDALEECKMLAVRELTESLKSNLPSKSEVKREPAARADFIEIIVYRDGGMTTYRVSDKVLLSNIPFRRDAADRNLESMLLSVKNEILRVESSYGTVSSIATNDDELFEAVQRDRFFDGMAFRKVDDSLEIL